MSKLRTRYESEVPASGMEREGVAGGWVTIPPFSTGLVNFLHAIRLFDLLLNHALMSSGRYAFSYHPTGSSAYLGHWYFFRTFGKPGLLKEVTSVRQ